MTFKSIRRDVPDQAAILGMMKKPRTTEEIAQRFRRPAMEMGQILAIMADRGLIRKAERRWGSQIWEPVQ